MESQDSYSPPLDVADLLIDDSTETLSDPAPTRSPGQANIMPDTIVFPARPSQPNPSQSTLPLLRKANWSRDQTYDEEPPTCIHYSIEWKVTLNNKPKPIAPKDTEPDLVLAPSDFWISELKPKLDRLIANKLSSNRSFRPDDTSVVVSVKDRTKRDFVKRFDGLDIDWNIIDRKLESWSHLFRIGRELRIDITFNYIETGKGAGSPAGRSSKRGFHSTTEEQLAKRARQLDAEELSVGHEPITTKVYKIMRCPGPHCNGPHCFVDRVKQKHYKLFPHHLNTLIDYVQQGGKLESQDDIPDHFRKQLDAEQKQELGHQQKRKVACQVAAPPVHITNVLPAQPPAPDQPPSAATFRAYPHVDIPGRPDEAVKMYNDWQCSRFTSHVYKFEQQKVCDITLAECLDLEQVHGDQEIFYRFYRKKGVKRGAARRFVRDIKTWTEKGMPRKA